jgi:hypothetical protein
MAVKKILTSKPAPKSKVPEAEPEDDQLVIDAKLAKKIEKGLAAFQEKKIVSEEDATTIMYTWLQ